PYFVFIRACTTFAARADIALVNGRLWRKTDQRTSGIVNVIPFYKVCLAGRPNAHAATVRWRDNRNSSMDATCRGDRRCAAGSPTRKPPHLIPQYGTEETCRRPTELRCESHPDHSTGASETDFA